MKDRAQLEDEGNALARKNDWNGLNILRICETALTDANFHHEAEILDQMLTALEEHDQPAFTLLVVNPLEENSADDTELDD